MSEEKPARKSWLKRVLKGICILLLVVLILAVAALLFIDHVAKVAVENAGPLVAKVPFQVERLWAFRTDTSPNFPFCWATCARKST